MTSKIPKDVLIQLEMQKGNTKKGIVNKLKDLFKAYIVSRESADTQSSQNEKSSEKKYYRNYSGKKSGFTQPNTRSSAEALVASAMNYAKRLGKYGPQKLCRYCEGNHWSDECRNYKTIEARKQKYKIKGSCYICLKPGHRIKHCTINKNCFYCQNPKITTEVFVRKSFN